MTLKKRNIIINLILAVTILFQIQTCKSDINRADFPNGFTFGTASSAFQVSIYFLIIH
ncbi:putative beta-glucosidase [Lupinus albus]|uniref:Putative beta-glucosidase n=1 Tax=Lupinus albus TaxID=3870 RepID=A0A6A4P9G6_LUPAL|nr:putative beta-glucosidase [Lupinus albus]